MLFNISKNPVKEKLDGVALSTELTLISVVQGVALAALGASSVGALGDFNIYHWTYVISGLLFILIFWSGAIVHALSFIDWPLDIWHNFLYFLATFTEVLAFGQLMNPQLWYFFIFLFFAVAMVLYIYDLGLMKKHEKEFIGAEEKKLYQHIISEQVFELKSIVPLGIIFNLIAAILIYFYPEYFIQNNYHLYISIVQMIFLLIFLINSMKSFKKRARLISNCI